METTYEIEAYEKYRNELRKNHSGMETGLLYGCLSFRRIRCVRTIVVWKRRIRRNREILGHCCVRTIVVWKPKGYRIVQSSDKVLRKNHSGMETTFLERDKYQIPGLRKNHSGMETGISSGWGFLYPCVA